MHKRMFAVLFAHGDPLSPQRLGSVLDVPAEKIPFVAADLRRWLEQCQIPLELLHLNGNFQLATKPEYAPDVTRVMEQRKNQPLSAAAMEVLAVIAYNQPVTKGFVEQVRGVDSGSVVNSLQEKGLVEEAGRLELPGRPLTYRVTEHFLRVFGMEDLSELPTLPMEEPPDDIAEEQITMEEYLSRQPL